MIDSADAHRIQSVEQRVSVSVERGMIEIDENQSVCERPVTDTIPANDQSVSTPTSSTASVKSTDGIRGSAGVSNSRPSCTSDAAVAAKENPADIDQAENKESLLCALEEHSEGNISGKSIVSVPESQSNEHVLPSDGRTEESDQTMQSLCEYQARSKQLVTDTFHVAKVSQTIESDDCGSNGVGCGGIMDSSGCGAAAAGAPVSDADSLADCGTDYGAGTGSGFQVVSLDGGEDKEDYDKGHLMHNNGTEPSSHAAFDDTIKAEIDRATPRHDSVPDYPCIDKQDPGHLDPAKAAFFRALSAKHKGHRQEASMPIATSSSNNSSGGTARSNSKWRSIGTAGSKMGGAVSSTISPLFGGGTTKWRVQQLRQGQQQNHVVVSTADRSSYITVDSVQNPFVMHEEETRVSAGAVRNVTARMGNDDDDGMVFIELSDLQSEYDGRPSERLTSEGTEIRPGSSSSVAANVGRILTGGSIGALEAIVRATSSNALSPAAGKNFPIHGTVQVTHQHNYYYNIQGPNASTASAAAVAGRGVVAGSSRYKGIKMSDDKSNSNRIGFPLRFDDITDDEEYAMCLKRQKEQSRQRVQQRRAKRRGRARREYGDDDDDNYSLPSDGDEDYSDEDEDKGVRRSGTTSKRRPTPPPPPPPPLLDISTPPPPYSAAAAALPAPPRSFKASAPGPSSSERLSHRPAVGDLPPPPIHQTTPQKHFAGSGRGNPPPPPPPPLSRTSAPPLGRGGSRTTTSNNNIRRSNNHKPPNEAGAEVDATAGDVNPSGNGNDGSDATAVAGTLDRQQSSRRWGHTPRRKLTRHERYELIKELRKIRYAVDQRDDNAVIRFLLSERVYGFPGSRGGIFTNYIQYIYAFHPVISIVMMNKRHPFKRRAGIVFMCSLSFAITASFVLIQTSLIPFLYTCRAGCNAQTLQNDDQDYLYGGTGVDGTDELTNEQDRTCVGGYNDGLDADSYDEYCQHYQSWMLGAVCGFIITIYDALLRLVATCGCIHGRSDMVSNTCCWAGLRGLAMYSSDRILIGFCCFSAAQFIIVAVLCYRLGIEYEVLLNLLLSELWSFAHWFYWALPYFLCKYHSDKKKFYQDLMVDIEQQQQRNQRFSRFQSRGRVRL